MRLTNLKATGFRSLQRIDLDFSPLTVLIGENDSGKSSVLDLISMCLSGGRPDSSDFYQDENGKTVDAAEAELAFQLDEDGDDNARPFALSDCLRVQFTFSRTPRQENAAIGVRCRRTTGLTRISRSSVYRIKKT